MSEEKYEETSGLQRLKHSNHLATYAYLKVFSAVIHDTKVNL